MYTIWAHNLVWVKNTETFIYTITVVLMSETLEFCMSLCHGVRSENSKGLSLVKTELNGEINILDFPFDVSLSTPLSFRSAMSIELIFLCLNYDQSFGVFLYFPFD